MLKMKTYALPVLLLLVASGLPACEFSGQNTPYEPAGTFEVLELTSGGNEALPVPVSGRVMRFEVESAHVTTRKVDIWLPPSYNEDQAGPHQVLYMHDGQMLFDSTETWNGQEWKVDEVLQELYDRNEVQPAIVVGVWNNADFRHAEYFPQAALLSIPEGGRHELEGRMPSELYADAYLTFLTQELKPFIDERFNVYTEREYTFIAGSSMGGLISMYALAEYPQVFGGAACLSTHWIGTYEGNELIPKAFEEYLAGKIEALDSHRLYFDHGTVGLDSEYGPHQLEINALLEARAPEGLRWRSEVFEGADHRETDWAARLDIPLRFLLEAAPDE